MLDLSSAVITDHAAEALRERNLSESTLRDALENPDPSQVVRPGRWVVQKMFRDRDAAKDYLLRVFVDVDRDPPEIVTVYRTSKITRYRG